MKMLYYEKNDVSEGIDIKKTSGSKECDICHYWYFLNYSLQNYRMSAIDFLIY